MSRRLIILRHAQAENDLGGADHERALTDAGRAQARAAGDTLAGAALVPDHAICSTALRARQTLELALERLPVGPTVDFEESAYGAGPEAVFELISMVGPEVGTLLVVGHNPTMAQMAASFADDGTSLAFSPASLAVATLDVDWPYAAPGAGTGHILT